MKYIYTCVDMYEGGSPSQGNDRTRGGQGIQVGRSESIPFSDFESWNLLYPIELR